MLKKRFALPIAALAALPGPLTEAAFAVPPEHEITIEVPEASAFGGELRMTHAMLRERRMPLWESDGGNTEVNCGGLDLYEVYKAARRGSTEVKQEMIGSPEVRLRIGPRLDLQFKTPENRTRYIALFQAGQAVPAYACWCAYGLAHPIAPHLAAPNNAIVTLRADTEGHSGLFFNLRERFPSWSANPDACISKSEREAASVLRTLSVETKRAYDRVFDEVPNLRPLSVQPCTPAAAPSGEEHAGALR
jgi:hypothetical protein